tara:strand:- start:15102 stop:15491 length:390 start_codon:yes stop_codon:yes gene_type:complete
MKISTNADTADRLIGAGSPDAETVQIHGHSMVNDVMRMRPVEGVVIPATGEALLAPGGFHIMLIGLKAPLFEETVIPLTLVFEKSGKVEIEAVIEAVIEAAGAHRASTEGAKAMPAPAGHGGHGAGAKP